MCGRREGHKKGPLRVPSKLRAGVMQRAFPSSRRPQTQTGNLSREGGDRMRRQPSRATVTHSFAQFRSLRLCKAKELKCRMAQGVLKPFQLTRAMLQGPALSVSSPLPLGAQPRYRGGATTGREYGPAHDGSTRLAQWGYSGRSDVGDSFAVVSGFWARPRAAIRRQGILRGTARELRREVLETL